MTIKELFSLILLLSIIYVCKYGPIWQLHEWSVISFATVLPSWTHKESILLFKYLHIRFFMFPFTSVDTTKIVFRDNETNSNCMYLNTLHNAVFSSIRIKLSKGITCKLLFILASPLRESYNSYHLWKRKL